VAVTYPIRWPNGYDSPVKLRNRWVAAASISVIALLGFGVARYVISRQHDEQIRRQMHAKAQAAKEEIDRRFPTGTTRAKFMEFADKWPGWRGQMGTDYYLSVGQQPSHVWYRGPWEVGVVMDFVDDRLTSTYISRWGLNCP
jgi:hypothetical protein